MTTTPAGTQSVIDSNVAGPPSATNQSPYAEEVGPPSPLRRATPVRRQSRAENPDQEPAGLSCPWTSMEEAIEAATTAKDHPRSEAHSRHSHPNTSRGITGARRGRGRTSGTAVAQAWPRGGPGAKSAHMGVATHFLNAVARGHSSITSPLGPDSLHGVTPHRSRAMRAMAPARNSRRPGPAHTPVRA
jgi:hypothetical protein